jgi:hypothetical protein
MRALVFKEELQILLATLLLFILSINLKYDFSQWHNALYYDVLFHLSQLAIPILISFIFISITMLLLDNNYSRLRLMWILFIPSIYVSEVLVNYPNIWARDVYLHGQVWELDAYGHVQSIHYTYPKEYPGFFLALYIIHKVLGISDIRVTNLFIFYPALIIVLMILIYMISRHVLKDWTLTTTASIIAFNLLQFNRNELTFVHANTRLYSLTLLLSWFYALLTYRYGLKNILLQSVLVMTLVMSHPLFQLVAPTTLLYLLLLNSILRHALRKKVNRAQITLAPRVMSLFLLALTTVALWNFFNYYNVTVYVGIKSIFDYVYHLMGLELITASVTIREPIPLLGIILRNYFKATIASITIVAAIYIAKKLFEGMLSYEELVLSSFALALASVFLSTVFTASLGNSIDRLLISFPIPVTVLFTKALSSIIQKRSSISNEHGNYKNKRRIFVVLTTIMLLTLVTLNGFLLVHEGSIKISMTPPLDSSSRFLALHKQYDQFITALPFNIYYVYFDPGAKISVINVEKAESIHEIAIKLILSYGVKVIDFHSILSWAGRYNDIGISLREWNSNVFQIINLSDNLIYNNGSYNYIYYKPFE